MAKEEEKADIQYEESDVDRINNVISSSQEDKDTETFEEPSHVEIIDEKEDDQVEEQPKSTPAEPKREPVAPKVAKHEKVQKQERLHAQEEKKPVEKKVHEVTSHAKKTVEIKEHPNKVHVKPKIVEHIVKKPIVQTHKAVKSSISEKVIKSAPKVIKTVAAKPSIALKEKIAVKEARPKMKKYVKSISKDSRTKNKISFKEERMAHKDKKNRSWFTKNTFLWIGIGVLAAILVIALVLILMPRTQNTTTAGNETTKSVAATVNGDPIYLQDVTKAYNDLSTPMKNLYSIDSMLNKSIDEMLLFQQAKNLGIEASKADIDSEIQVIKLQNGLTDKDLEAALQKQGMTLKDAEDIIAKNMIIRKLLNSTILKDIKVSDDEINKYYLLHTSEFQEEAKVTVQHILITANKNVTFDQSKAKVEQISKELTADNFCELAAKYSEDPGSKDACGQYTFAKGDFNNPDFENPSFDLKINETAIVKTSFGYHLIKKIGATPARIKDVSEVKKQIESIIYDQKVQDKFEGYIQDLRAKATIVNYLTKGESAPVVGTTVTASSLEVFAKCLTEKKATFYGAYWCPHCNNQKALFGDSLKYINYVECAVEGQPQVQTKACTDAGISGYPTWIINGKSYPGEQTFANLAKLTGCIAPQ